MRRENIYITLISVCVGLIVGVGLFTFMYADGAAYMTNNPAACANCHVMQSHYDAWLKSSHRSVATCNDCHTPKGFIPKYITKALNGFWHSWAFTTGSFHEPIQIKARNAAITDQACRKCHQDIVFMIEGVHSGKSDVSCVRCHNSVGHATGK